MARRTEASLMVELIMLLDVPTSRARTYFAIAFLRELVWGSDVGNSAAQVSIDCHSILKLHDAV